MATTMSPMSSAPMTTAGSMATKPPAPIPPETMTSMPPAAGGQTMAVGLTPPASRVRKRIKAITPGYDCRKRTLSYEEDLDMDIEEAKPEEIEEEIVVEDDSDVDETEEVLGHGRTKEKVTPKRWTRRPWPTVAIEPTISWEIGSPGGVITENPIKPSVDYVNGSHPQELFIGSGDYNQREVRVSNWRKRTTKSSTIKFNSWRRTTVFKRTFSHRLRVSSTRSPNIKRDLVVKGKRYCIRNGVKVLCSNK